MRVISKGPTFASLVSESFNQIRESAKGNVAIMLRMLGALQAIASQTASPDRRRTLRDNLQWIAELGERTIEAPHDKSRFENRVSCVREALETAPTLVEAWAPHEQPVEGQR